jgi:hypothetical protein
MTDHTHVLRCCLLSHTLMITSNTVTIPFSETIRFVCMPWFTVLLYHLISLVLISLDLASGH